VRKPNSITIAVAAAFLAGLREDIGPARFRAVVLLNRKEKHPGICHSHDFCDANMTMLAACEKVVGPRFDNTEDEHAALWNAAWALAAKWMKGGAA